MKGINRAFSIVSIFATTLTWSAADTSGQVLYKRNSPIVSTQTQPQPKSDAWKPLPASAVTGTINARIIWSKAMGLPPLYPGSTETTALPCGSFVIAVNDQRGRIKSSEGQEITSDRSLGNERYVCDYTLDGLPKERELRVDAVFIDTRVWETYPWISIYSANGVAPGPGQVRVLYGGRRLILTDGAPAINVDFSIEYETPRRPIKIF